MSPESEATTLSIGLEHPSELVVDLSIRCQDYPQQQDDERSPDYQLSLILSRLLQYGVWISTATVLLGGLLYLLHHGLEPVNYQTFRGEPDIFRSPAGVIDAVFSGRRRGVIQLGLLFLIATPIIRVLIALIFFIRKRDFSYILITGLVISGLLYSMLGAYL